MNNITITGKRRWHESGKEYFECYCNGDRIAGLWEGSDGGVEKAMIQGAKDTCKLYKCFGPPKADELVYKNGVLSSAEWEIFHATDLPEWDVV